MQEQHSCGGRRTCAISSAARKRCLSPGRGLWAWLVVLALLAAGGGGHAQSSRAVELYEAGLRLKQAEDLAGATERFQAAVRADPNYPLAYWGLAWAYVSLGKEADAVEAFRGVIRLAPHTEEGVEAARAIERIRLRRPDLKLPAPEPQTFVMALTLTRGGRTDLYLADARGSVRRRLTDDTAVESQPCFSPDTRRIAFVSDRGGSRNLWLVRTDGRNLQQLTQTEGENYSPDWTPDAEEIVFVSTRSGRAELWLLDLLTNETRSLQQPVSAEAAPRWSPDGRSLAFVSDREGTGKIYVWRRDTGEVRRLLAGTVSEHGPVWSVDGRSLFFNWRLEGHWQVCRAEADGQGLQAARATPDNEILWGMSPDGQWLLVSSDRTGRSRFYLAQVEGEELRAVGPPDAEITGAALSPALTQSVARVILEAPAPGG